MEPRAWMRGEKGLQALEWITRALGALALPAALAFGLKRTEAGPGEALSAAVSAWFRCLIEQRDCPLMAVRIEKAGPCWTQPVECLARWGDCLLQGACEGGGSEGSGRPAAVAGGSGDPRGRGGVRPPAALGEAAAVVVASPPPPAPARAPRVLRDLALGSGEAALAARAHDPSGSNGLSGDRWDPGRSDLCELDGADCSPGSVLERRFDPE
jgi:hypothetical protein